MKWFAIAICIFATVLCADDSDVVMLQGFHWESHATAPWWNVISEKAEDIAESGFTVVWFPPSSAAASDEGYLPNRLYMQNSRYGSSEQLKSAIAALRARGVGAVADIVINHRVGTKDWGDFTEPSWGTDAVCRDDEWPNATGNDDSGDGYGAARDIDHTQKYVRDSIVQWMQWLQTEIGYSGWRYDYVKGYSGSYNRHYNQATAPHFSVGELWDDLDLNNPNPHRQQLCDWIDATEGTSSAFDFTTKGILQHAVRHHEYWRLRDRDGKPVGLIGWWPAKAVTFIDNHDTGPSPGGGQNHWPFPANKVMQGYAYILTHPGVPCVYWVHYYDWGLRDEIKALLTIRKQQRIQAASKVVIAKADNSEYAAIIDDKVAVKIGPGNWNPGAGWQLATWGEQYAVWTRLK